jgi:rhodanese-related sulfurtransferase
MFNLFSSEAKAYKSLSGREFKEGYAKSKQPVLIDVRTAGEFASGSIANAKNIDVMSPNFLNQISSLDKNKDYFIFCRSGNRSGQACSIMAELGYNVYNLKGGVGAWRDKLLLCNNSH